MATLLYRLGKTAFRRWPLFLAGWLAVMVVVGTVAATMSKPMTDAFSIPGIPSEKAADLQAELFPGSIDAFDQANVNVVVQAPEGHTLDEPEYSKAVDDLIGRDQYGAAGAGRRAAAPTRSRPPSSSATQIRRRRQGERRIGPSRPRANAQALSPLSEDGRTGIISFNYDVETPMDIEPASQDALNDIMDEATESGLTVEANGAGMGEFAPPGGASELIGIGLALVVLILTFGSLVAAGLPILTAIFGVALGMTTITAMTAFMDIGSSTPILATMIGLAVGIDYALFILARYRGELQHTDDREEAVGIAVGTAGSAVVFAGLTVLIALSALAVVNIPFLTAMGLAAAGTVLIAVLVALTLLPAILGLFKSKAFGGQVRKYNPKREADGHILNNGVRWARTVARAPVAIVIVVVVALGALAIPLQGLHLAFPSDSTAPTDTTVRKASDMMADAFGPGREGPLLVVVDGRDLPEADRGAAYDDVAAWAGEQAGRQQRPGRADPERGRHRRAW